MKLKELEGKKAIRTKPRYYKTVGPRSFGGLLVETPELLADRSYIGEEVRVIKVTEQMAYIQRLTGYGSSRVPEAISLAEYDDGGWEESLLSELREQMATQAQDAGEKGDGGQKPVPAATH